FVAQPWKDYGGEVWTNGTESALAHPAAHNGLFKMVRDSFSFWVAGVQPRDGANTLTDLVPGQMLGLDTRIGTTTTEIPMTLSPYSVTVPALKAVSAGGNTLTDVDYTSEAPAGSFANPVVLDTDGTVNMQFYRPQRLALPGEALDVDADG